MFFDLGTDPYSLLDPFDYAQDKFFCEINETCALGICGY
jgi:hypothetical protein